MKLKYFQITDTLYIKLYQAEVDETRNIDKSTLLDMDRSAITIKHADERMTTSRLLVRVGVRLN